MNSSSSPIKHRLQAGLLSLLLITPAFAHIVRIEPTTTGQLVILFGEPGEKSETSPGQLDLLSLPITWTPTDTKPVLQPVTKQTEHFSLTAETTNKPVLAETQFPAFKRGSHPASWPQFYQRWHPVGTSITAQPGLTFDIVPTDEAGTFRIYFRGQPLAGVEVDVAHRGAGIGAHLVSDENGTLTYTTDHPGLVIMTANHQEPFSGFTRGQPDEVISHNIALTWAHPESSAQPK